MTTELANPIKCNTYFTEERLQCDLNFYRAQQIAKAMLTKGLISLSEFHKLSDINFDVFSPLFAEITPKSLDIPPVSSNIG